MIQDKELRSRLQLGEDSLWEFKQIEFSGHKPKSPRKEDLADEIGAFANADGGILLCGVTDERTVQHMSRQQMAALGKMLSEICTDILEPPVRIHVHNRKLDQKTFILVQVPRGYSVHARAGKAFVRVGSTKTRMQRDEILRITQNRTKSRYIWTDKQTVPETGFETLSERLWEPLLSTAGAVDPQKGLRNLHLLAENEEGVVQATLAGILICTPAPQTWLPYAAITATHYRGLDRASGQLDARDINGPLPQQIADAMQFVKRNMRVSARKKPERENLPQYAMKAVFEAAVNAVAHRDYSMSSRKIRLSMFKNRLEIESPGMLPNGMTIDSMEASQSTRNEVIASVFGSFPITDMAGSGDREYLMERRGDGVSIIRTETRNTAGLFPEYELIDNSSLVLRIPAAKLELVPADATVTVHSRGDPLAGIEVLALFPNKTSVKATTDESGNAALNLYTTNLPMRIYVAGTRYAAGLEHDWIPESGGLMVELEPLDSGGSVIFAKGSGYLPGLHGRLNPVHDTSDRTYMYADNIAVNDGRQEPVPFRPGKPLRLTDAYGYELSLTVVDILGQSCLVEYRPYE